MKIYPRAEPLAWRSWVESDFLGGGIAQPLLGKIYDLKFELLGDELAAGSATLRTVIVLTVILTAAFIYLYLKQRAKVK